MAYLLQRAFVGTNTFNQRNGEWIQLIGLVSLVDNRQRNAEVQDLEIADFLGQRDDFGQKIDAKTEGITPSTNAGSLGIDGKDTSGYT